MEIPAAIRQYIKNNSILLKESECRPLLLDGEYGYYIESGSVNIFCAFLGDDKTPGNRNYVAHCGEGRLLFPAVPANHKNSNICIIADAFAGSKIFRLKGSWIDLLSNKNGTGWGLSMLEAWIRDLSAWFPAANVPLQSKIISPDELESRDGIFEFEANTDFMPEKGLLWMSVKKGFCAICGNEKNVSLHEGSIFPVSRYLWGRTYEKTVIEFKTSQEALKEGVLKDYLMNFYENFFRSFLLSDACRKKLALDKSILLTELENKALEASFQELSALNNKISHDASVSPEALSNPSFAVLEVLGKVIGTEFKFPAVSDPNVSFREQLLFVLEHNSVYYRRVKLDGAWWKEEGSCMVGFRKEDGSPVGLIYDRKGTYLLYDPKENIYREITRDNVAELDDSGYTLYSRFSSQKQRLRDILLFSLRHLRSDIRLAFMIALLGGIVSLIQPFVTGIIFNNVIPDSDVFQLCQVGVMLFTAVITGTLFALGRSFALLRIKTVSGYKLQAAVIGKLLRLPLPLFRRYSTGDLAQRVMSVETIKGILTDSAIDAFFVLFVALPNLILMFYYSYNLTLCGIAFLSVFFLVLALIGYLNFRNQRHEMQINGELSGFVLQSLVGINKIRNSVSENRVFIKWATRFAEETRWHIKSIKNNNILSLFYCVYPALITGIFFYLVGETWKGSLNVGNYLAFIAAFTVLMTAVVGFAQVLPLLISIIPLYQRLTPVLEACPESEDSLKSPGSLDGNVELNHVSFRYDPDYPLVLNDINIKVEPGEFIAVVGPSGAGKSSIIRLLLGFDDPESGAVFYGGKQICSINKRELRKQIGSVLQGDGLISGSIYENIAGASELSMEDAWSAAEMAGCADDIREMPMGMHTIVGNGTLSGGQSQRILIARALAKKPKIIIFDEATSAVDNETQAHISQSLKTLNATKIVVAHRLSTIIDADRIYVLEKGQLVQTGSFDKLVKEPGIFSTLAKRQMV